MAKKKRKRNKIIAEKLDHISIKLGEIYAELMKKRYREKTKPSARVYSRYRKHKKENYED
jgi:hypothetical protein